MKAALWLIHTARERDRTGRGNWISTIENDGSWFLSLSRPVWTFLYISTHCCQYHSLSRSRSCAVWISCYRCNSEPEWCSQTSELFHILGRWPISSALIFVTPLYNHLMSTIPYPYHLSESGLTFVASCGGGSGRALLSLVWWWARWGGRLNVTLAAGGSSRAASALSPGAGGLGGWGAWGLCCVDRTRARGFPPQVVFTGDDRTCGRLASSSRVRI